MSDEEREAHRILYLVRAAFAVPASTVICALVVCGDLTREP